MKHWNVIVLFFLSIAPLFAAEQPTSNNSPDSLQPPPPFLITISPSLLAGLNLYSENWSGGEVGAFTWTAKLDIDFEKKFSDKIMNLSLLRFAFGQTMNQTSDSVTGENSWSDPLKSVDNIEFKSDFDFTLKTPIDPYFGLHLQSQFADKSTKKNLNGNPITISELAGIVHKTSETEAVTLSSRLAVGARQNIDRNRQTDTVVINDAGFQFEMHLKGDHPSKILLFNSDFYLFKAFARNIAVGSDWKSPDLNWENRLSIKVTKVLTAEVLVQMLYDKEVTDKQGNPTGARWKENGQIGISYTFTNKK